MKTTFVFVFLSLFIGLNGYGDDFETTVSADFAKYDGHRILLEGHVDVRSDSYVICAKQALLIRDLEKKTRFEFPWIELCDEVSAHFFSKYFLECNKVNLDYVTQHLFFSGRNQSRLYFYEKERKVYAEKADIEYEEKEGKIVLKKITLIGNVEMHMISEENEEKKAQYALADIVEYYPEKEMLFLKADPDKRVLFFDKIHELSISSQIVKAHKKNGKEVVEGVGDVRFTFKEDEFDKLKKRFNFS